MKNTFKKVSGIVLASAFLLASCSKDVEFDPVEEDLSAVSAKASIKSLPFDLKPPTLQVKLPKEVMFNDVPFDFSSAVEPSKCTLTVFDDVIAASVSSNLDSIGASWYNTYAELNFLSTITDESPQTFGAKGEDTDRVKRITRNLERFWFMPKEVTVRGQHNSTLEDYDKIVDLLMFWYELPAQDANAYAFYFINFVNEQSTFLTETPLLSFDGFAIALEGLLDQNDLIVVGDGIVELLAETGIGRGVVWNGVLAHEWAHHIQFNNEDKWYPEGAADNAPEATRTTELEADFFASYYVSHTKGAIQNWRRTRQFLELFFNIGDCQFTSDGHHGTPLQRMEAARRGYNLARKVQKNGKILTANQVHNRFLKQLPKIIGDKPVIEDEMEELQIIQDEYQLDVEADALQ